MTYQKVSFKLQLWLQLGAPCLASSKIMKKSLEPSVSQGVHVTSQSPNWANVTKVFY